MEKFELMEDLELFLSFLKDLPENIALAVIGFVGLLYLFGWMNPEGILKGLWEVIKALRWVLIVGAVILFVLFLTFALPELEKEQWRSEHTLPPAKIHVPSRRH